jgi:hypothetical protein
MDLYELCMKLDGYRFEKAERGEITHGWWVQDPIDKSWYWYRKLEIAYDIFTSRKKGETIVYDNQTDGGYTSSVHDITVDPGDSDSVGPLYGLLGDFRLIEETDTETDTVRGSTVRATA